MPASPADFGLDSFEPMTFAKDEPAEEQSRVIDGPPVARRGAPVPTIARPASKAGAMTATELKRQLRARLREVNAEIRLRSKLEAERAELVRLLAAAQAKPAKQSPRADVRPIRTAAG